MKRIFVIAMLALAPAMFAHGPKWKNNRGHGKVKYYAPAPMYYAPPPVVYYAPPPAMYWTPAYGVIPPGHRKRMRVGAWADYGPVPYGCRRAFLDGYVVDYRPGTYVAVNFFKAW